VTVPILERSLGRQRLSMFMGAPQTRTIKVARDALTPLAYTDDSGWHPPAGAARISERSGRRIPSFAGVWIWGRGGFFQ